MKISRQMPTHPSLWLGLESRLGGFSFRGGEGGSLARNTTDHFIIIIIIIIIIVVVVVIIIIIFLNYKYFDAKGVG